MSEFLRDPARRRFLKLAAFSAADFVFAACGVPPATQIPQREKAFFLEGVDTEFRTALILPEGKDHPETGDLITSYNEGALIRSPQGIGPGVFVRNTLQLDVIFRKLEFEDGVEIVTSLAKPNEGTYQTEKPKVYEVDLSKAHDLKISWKNWLFREIKLDGNVIWKPQTD